MENKILQGDALTKLRELPEKSINMCMTSPPYWALRDYGTASWEGGSEDCNHLGKPKPTQKGFNERWSGKKNIKKDKQGELREPFLDVCGKCGAKRVDKQLGLESTFEEYINKLCDIFDEVKRVLRDDGTCWVNLGDTYAGSGNGSNDYRNKKTKNYRKGEILYKGQKSGKTSVSDKSLVMMPFRFAIEMVNRGWILRNTIIWHKPNCMPSSVKDRFTVDFEYIFFFSKKKNYYFKTQYEPHLTNSIKRMDAGFNENPDFHYKKRIDKNRGFKTKSNEGQLQPPQKHGQDVSYNPQGRNKRTVWKISPKPFKEAHFAVYPEELCETPIKAGCPVGGVILDPFLGAGTTCVVALKQGKKFIGIELSEEYIKIAEARLKPYLEQEKLI